MPPRGNLKRRSRAIDDHVDPFIHRSCDFLPLAAGCRAVRRPIGLRVDWTGEPTTGLDKLREQCEGALRAGFDCIELAMPDGGASPGERAEEIDHALIETLAEAKVSVAALSARCEMSTIVGTVQEVGTLLSWTQSVRAKGLNLRFQRPVHAGDNGDESEACFRCHRDVVNAVFEVLRRVRLDAERAGIMLSLEPVDLISGLSPLETCELIDLLSAWPFGACVDLARLPGRASPEDQKHLVGSWLLTLRQRVRCVRVATTDGSDSFGGRADEHPGDLAAFLDEIQYAGPIICAQEAEPAEILVHHHA